MLIQQMTVGEMGVCCYLLGCEETGKGAIVDAGGNENDILAASKKAKLDIKYILCTHGHPDHVCGNSLIKQATGCDIIMHEDDAAFFDRKETINYFSMFNMTPSPPADKLVKGGDIVTIGNIALKILHTPGHTPGSICFYNHLNVFTGDTLFVGGVGRTDFPGGSSSQLLQSIKTQLLTLPQETVVWPGHGYGGLRSTIQTEEQRNPFLTGGGW